MTQITDLIGAKAIDQLRDYVVVWYGDDKVYLYSADDELLGTLVISKYYHEPSGYAEVHKAFMKNFLEALRATSDVDVAVKNREEADRAVAKRVGA